MWRRGCNVREEEASDIVVGYVCGFGFSFVHGLCVGY